MEKIHAAEFVDKDVPLDGKHYINGSFTRCVFVYNGGEFSIEQSLAREDCTLKLGDAAGRTAEVLRQFGYIRPDKKPLEIVE